MNLPLKTTRFLTLRTAWLETLAFTALMPVLGYLINAADPFFLDNGFPWLILAPVLIGLRYGFFFGMGSALLLITLFIFGRHLNWVVAPDFPVEMVVGMLIITIIMAEFNDIWQQKLKPLQHKYHQLKLRMDEFSRAYQILKGSHALLEQQTAKYKSMRTSLLDLQKQTLTFVNNEGEPLSGIGDQILKLFSEFGSIQTASVYAVSGAQKIGAHPVACLGNPPSFWPTNPLLREALKTGGVTSLQNYSEEMTQEILVVIPLVDIFQKTWGVVVVNEMSMFALQENTLDLLSLLGGHIGDLIRRRAEVSILSKDVWLEFEHELLCAMKEVYSYKKKAAVIAFISNDVQMHDFILTRFSSELRGLDKVLCFKNDFDRQIIINLLPLTDGNGLNDFISRFGLMHSIDSKTLMDHGEGNAYQTIYEDVTIYSWILNDTHSPEKIVSKVKQLCQCNEQIVKNGGLSHAEIFV